MANRFQEISALLEIAANKTTSSVSDLKSFLSCSAWHYKYGYADRVLIYAQRPNATACAEFEVWNEKLDRRIQRGSRGIALILNTVPKARLRYVFDVSDTYSRRNVPFRLWSVKQEFETVVSEALSDNFGFDMQQSLDTNIFGAAVNSVSDNAPDYVYELSQRTKGSLLEGLSEDELATTLYIAMSTAVAHTVLVRLGFDPDDYLHEKDYEAALKFNTYETAAVLGTAVGDVSENILRTVERTVRSAEKRIDIVERADDMRDNSVEIKTERRNEYGDHLHGEGRASVPRFDTPRAEQRGYREVRTDAPQVPQGAPQGAVLPSDDEARAERSSAGDQQAGERNDRSDNRTDGEGAGSERSAESIGSASVDTEDERDQSIGGGAGNSGDSSELNTESEDKTGTPPVFSISQEDFDAELIRHGSGFADGKFRIYRFYQANPTKEDAVKFLKNEYGIGGHSHTYLDGTRGFVDHDGKGLKFSVYSLSEEGKIKDRTELLFKWPQVDTRLRFLIEAGRYLSWTEIAYLPEYDEKLREQEARAIEERRKSDERFAAMMAQDEKRKSAEYRLTLGASVHIGSQEYSILAFDDEKVSLFNPRYPLISEEMPREQFVQRLRENPMNDGLIDDGSEKSDETPVSEATQETNEAEPAQDVSNEVESSAESELYSDKLNIGDTVEHDGRTYVIERIGELSHDVSMRDTTFEGSTGVPINRVEKIETVLRWLEESERGLTPAWEKIKPEASPIVHSHRGEKHDFRITDMALGYGGLKTKFRMNIEAIKLLKQLDETERLATPEEQEVLLKYVGWGALPMAFDERNEQWKSEYAELKELLTDEEYTAARASTLNAHYTSPTVIQAMYAALAGFGFKKGNILEPSCGVGNFFGMLPDEMRGSKLYGVELDPLTGRIAKQLYQNAKIAVQGFEETNLPDSFFDVAIGNVPFGDYSVSDKKYDKEHFLIHDYFIAKSLDKVRPGGVVAFVTSSGTLDKKNPAARKYLAKRAELIGAIRLPNNAFQKNAGTSVVTDILFLQKRDRPIDIEPEWVHLGQTEEGYTINQYFIDNPQMVLGTLATESTQYGRQETTVAPIEDEELSEQLRFALTNIHTDISIAEDELDPDEDEVDTIPADPAVRNYSFTLYEGDVYFREDSVMRKVDAPATALSRIKGMIELRDSVRKVIAYQLEGWSDEVVQDEQKTLNGLYDSFIKKYGLISSRANKNAFSGDSSYSLLSSLEILGEDGELIRKADIFSKRTIRQKQEKTHVDGATEALAVSLNERAKVDLPYMAQLTGKAEEKLEEELGGIVFRDISSFDPAHVLSAGYQRNRYPLVTADEFLSGNVRQKLHKARALFEQLLRMDEASNTYSKELEYIAGHIAALEKVQPQQLTASEIDVRLGATWLPTDIVQDFMYELLNPNYWVKRRMRVQYSPVTAQWNITEKNADFNNPAATLTYGTSRINAYKIIEETLNLKDVRIFDTIEDQDGREVRVLNKKETILAQQKQQSIKDAFKDWVWKDPQRRDRLTELYNERFNSTRPREYDGSHIEFIGMNPEIKLREHQQNAVARIMYGGNTLLAHVVGAGKTYTMAAAAMEMKRLGLCSKSLFVVPNHLIEQWAAEFQQLYPAANLLVATKKDFETANRKKFCSRIATGDYDAIIIGHSQFEKIPISIERQRRIIEEQIEEITDGIQEAKIMRSENFTIKQLEKTKRMLKTKLDKLNDQSRKDDVVTFEELGIDRMFIDEAHNYKNLFLHTKMRNVAGLSQTEAQKSSDMFMKCRYLDELTGNRGTIFATGTPVSNSMTELYTMQRYLQYDGLREKGLQHFDAWASTFGETITAIELAPEGTGYRAKTRFARFYNLPELIAMFRHAADIQTSDMLKLPIPEATYHNEVIKPSEFQKEMVSSFAERAERVRAGAVNPSVDNMLKITNDGRKVALDQRLSNAALPDDESSKVSSCTRNIFAVWERSKDNLGTQLVFCDLSIPKDDGSFNVYDDVKKKLMEMGIPEGEIAFIHDAASEAQKAALFSNVRSGKVRILLGSTPKMGAGTNVQTRLIAEHHLDIPWRPSDIEQREGRILRQGNTNPKVEIYRYVTESTFDSYMWQTIENKQKFISQIMTSKSPVRSCEDVDETALSYAEVKALATGNPYIKEKMDLEVQVSRLKLVKANFLSQRYALEDRILKQMPFEIRSIQERIDGYRADIELYKANASAEFPGMTIKGTLYEEKKDAGAALLATCKAKTNPKPESIGTYRGFDLQLEYDVISKQFRLNIKGTMSHFIDLGTDVHGNIQRIENAFSGFEERLHANEQNLITANEQFEQAKLDVERPFEQEEELRVKSARLAELDALLNIDRKENEPVIDTDPEQEETDQELIEHYKETEVL